ncbi:hypothetical protein CTAYLR_003482 [Chrysophaeum taylorii]|uniref:Prokaryotic-type class I peptide chain release factors domain-containing protein n=1 Tax=Chrysophaeum taylorii TaxID=2483200 RepID=A0AAD7XI15_9STRA|nr:hypothetical protein CTAYLR_003482 [Chrysophaeum taylorii]
MMRLKQQPQRWLVRRLASEESLARLESELASAVARLEAVSGEVVAAEMKARELEDVSGETDFWGNAARARRVTAELAALRGFIDDVAAWRASTEDAMVAIEAAREDDDAEFFAGEAREAIDAVKAGLDAFELERTMSGPYDDRDCRLEIHAGAGGLDAQDWCSMLLRMYERYCDKTALAANLLETADGDHPGCLKSAVLEIRGRHAYGLLRSEKGAHRLVRQSPFNSAAKRQTSFASVEPIPMLADDLTLDIPDADLDVSTMRSSGAGGQNVNKVETAVRILHKPTGLSVKCMRERSQFANKKIAMALLSAKLLALLDDQRKHRLDEIRGDKVQADFGSSVRNYVLHPYKLVKDDTYETPNAEAVLDGDLHPFLQAALRARAAAPAARP